MSDEEEAPKDRQVASVMNNSPRTTRSQSGGDKDTLSVGFWRKPRRSFEVWGVPWKHGLQRINSRLATRVPNAPIPQTFSGTHFWGRMRILGHREETEETEGLVDGKHRVDKGYPRMMEVAPTLLVAAFGLILYGVLLDYYQHWKVFENVPELFILVPVLLGLKGGLDLTLASRLSAMSHMGMLNTPARTRHVVITNLALVQVQAMAVGCFSGALAVSLQFAFHDSYSTNDALTVVIASMISCSVAGIAFGLVTCTIVIFAGRIGANADNIATPLASSLGDPCTLVCLALAAAAFFWLIEDGRQWIVCALGICQILLTPLFIAIARKDDSIAKVLVNGWPPFIICMILSNGAGLFVESGIEAYPTLASVMPVVDGLGGNLACVYASRISHSAITGVKEKHLRTMLTLILLNLPVQIVYLLFVKFSGMGHSPIDFVLVSAVVSASLCQVLVLYVLVHVIMRLEHWMKLNPDMYSTPLLTSCGDLVGSCFLLMVFKYADKLL